MYKLCEKACWKSGKIPCRSRHGAYLQIDKFGQKHGGRLSREHFSDLMERLAKNTTHWSVYLRAFLQIGRNKYSSLKKLRKTHVLKMLNGFCSGCKRQSATSSGATTELQRLEPTKSKTTLTSFPWKKDRKAFRLCGTSEENPQDPPGRYDKDIETNTKKDDQKKTHEKRTARCNCESKRACMARPMSSISSKGQAWYTILMPARSTFHTYGGTRWHKAGSLIV